jgi:glycosyltransferase involved in cell wall biosynthesis
MLNSNNSHRRVLVVTYTFPPVGGAGVQRIAKFVKYLPKHGWMPTVLTVENPSVPVFDESLAADIPADVPVVRTRSWEPSYSFKKSVATGDASKKSSMLGSVKNLLRTTARSTASLLLQPDFQVLWYPNAVAKGKSILKTTPHDVIFVTAPPFSAFLIGRTLAKHAKLPLLIDYRDEWTISNDYLENKNLGAISRAIQTRQENRVLRSAHGVMATTQASAESIRGRCREAGAKADVGCIYNGFDADDFHNIPEAPRDRSRLRIVYTGTLWNLTSIAPLVEAIKRLEASDPSLVGNIEVVLVGRKVGGQLDCVAELKRTGCHVVEHDYMDHKAALEILCSTDIACLLLTDVPGAERVVPAKLFEYVASKRAILGITPKGETWELLKSVSRAVLFEPSDVAGIAGWIKSAVQDRSMLSRDNDSADQTGFDRDSQAKQLAQMLDKMLVPGHS